MILPRYALFAAMLAAAGLPIYLHAPKVYADEYGVGLAGLGVLLFALRSVDLVQDPLLGWIAGRLQNGRALAALIGAGGLAAGMIGLFAIVPPISPIVWMCLCLVVLFTSYSFLSILFYARGIGQSESWGPGGHVRLAAWREVGALIGVSFASMAPVILASSGLANPFAAFAIMFAGLALVATAFMHPAWPGPSPMHQSGFAQILRDGQVRLLLAVGLANAAPVAITATLFLFFVEYRLERPDLSGPFLLAFFVAAAVGAALFSAAARRYGTIRMLGAGMTLSIVTFVFAFTLGSGDALAFFLVCIGSGAALGADMALLPALFAQRVATISGNGGQAFGLWNFCAKLAFAAGAIVLTLLDASGFRAGQENSPEAVTRLAALYALLPCALKLIALGMLPLVWRAGRRSDMISFVMFAAGLGLGLAFFWLRSRVWTFQSQSPADYAVEAPTFDIRSELDGPMHCQGVIFDLKGRASSRFTADMNGKWTNQGGTLSENFVYHSGRKQDRCWTIKMGDNGAFTATAPDVIGEGHGMQSGPTVRLTYRIKLPEDVGSHELDVVDWMYLAGDGVILNRSEFRKYGIKVAELFATMKKAA